ncbi:hypothetical protein MRB53_042013 [Persea americana]|nr:hypothetical protein MRB53_042013 [Persea americana]
MNASTDASIKACTNLPAKRKRSSVTYAIDDVFRAYGIAESQEDDDSSDDAFQAHDNAWPRKDIIKSPPKKARTSKPARRFQKPFPFLSLPAEIRDMIYEELLVDGDLEISEHTRHYRRTVRRTIAPGAYDPARPLKALGPSILGVNKQIHSEAISCLYRRTVNCDEPLALEQFLATIGTHSKYLVSIRLRAWGTGRGTHHAANFSAFALLGARCPNLQHLVLPGEVVCSRGSIGLARQIYRNCHVFFEEFGTAHGKRDAVLDILEMTTVVPTYCGYWGQKKPFAPESEEAFRTELRRLLGAVSVEDGDSGKDDATNP